MKRFIRYLYEYDKKKRIRNVGFVKVEAGNEETIVHMQVKGMNSHGQQMWLYLFYEENGEIIKIPHDEIKLLTPTISHHMIYRVADENLNEIYDRIGGILIEDEEGRKFAGTWDEQEIDVSQIREQVAGAETAADQEAENDEPQISEEAEKEKGFVKISRQEISRLPRCEWNLVNNQFLMHGYENFHHLLLIDNGNYLKLGVPGIYHIKEAKCAEIFGFEEFLTAEELGIESEEEMFGYWCRPVRRYQKR